MYPFYFFPAKRKIIFNIHGLFRVMRQLIFFLLSETQSLFAQTQIQIPIHPLLLPILKPFVGPSHLAFILRIFNFAFISRSCEPLHFHLLKFARAKSKIARRDFIAKSFADLGNAKGYFFTRRFHYRIKININGLGCFRAHIYCRPFVFHRPQMSL